MIDRKTTADEYPKPYHIDDSFLLVLDSQTQSSAWITELKEQAIPALSRDIHYARIAIGLKDGKRPYAVVTFKPNERHHLERRWILSQFYRSLRSQFKASRLCIFMNQQSTQDIVMAEDGYLAAMRANDEGNEWSQVTIIHTKSPEAVDPFGKIRFEAMQGYRRWINENPDEMTSIEIGKRLKAFADDNGCGFVELGLDELKKENMNLLLAVGQGSQRSPARCYYLTHKLTPGKKPIMLLGKGITFDTGGINVKAFESFVNAMKNDMGGAALMSHLFMALVKSGYSEPLVLAIPTCENLTDANSMKPGSLVQSRKGPKVFIEHTDAEGRLILVDALSYGEDKYQPSLTITAATLTTACLRQFSNYFTAVHFASDKFQTSLHESGKLWGERFSCWEDFLPFANGNKTKFGDITNLGRLPSHASMGGGSNVAAHFIREFATGPLIHFDIFASCWNWSGDYPGSPNGATGAPFNSLFETLRKGFN
ncbi:MAG: hypothetical protein EOP07_16430 [Proteobacteria bacterium]|nr:MAG: hypothetical protein EOP07_16430 [Pseudomonadota bacterium]